MNETPMPIQIKEANKAVRSFFERAFAMRGLDDVRPQEGQMLHYIATHPGCSSMEITQARRCSKASVSESLGILVACGYIECAPSPEDRREKRLVITEKGKERECIASKIMEECEKQIMEGFSENERDNLRRYLTRVIENAERREDGRD